MNIVWKGPQNPSVQNSRRVPTVIVEAFALETARLIPADILLLFTPLAKENGRRTVAREALIQLPRQNDLIARAIVLARLRRAPAHIDLAHGAPVIPETLAHKLVLGIHRALAHVGAIGQAAGHVLSRQREYVEEHGRIGVADDRDRILAAHIWVEDFVDDLFGFGVAEADHLGHFEGGRDVVGANGDRVIACLFDGSFHGTCVAAEHCVDDQAFAGVNCKSDVVTASWWIYEHCD